MHEYADCHRKKQTCPPGQSDICTLYTSYRSVSYTHLDVYKRQAEEKARGIIDEAVKTAEEKKRESMLEIKEESIKAKNDLDKEIKERRNEISRNERRIVQKLSLIHI